jgi:N-hydroxyarylamine O-acetyltransferase
MSPKPNLELYFERIAYSGPATPTLKTLTALHALHPQALSFDGLSPFLGEPVSLALPALEDKLLKRRRGGYCFEQNVLFWRVLEAIGFRVSGLSGRVRLGWPDEVITPRGHMALLVTLAEGNFIADVGFGKLTVTAPVRLEIGLEQCTPHEPVRIVERSKNVYALQARLEQWQTLYTFDLQESFIADYEMYNWFYARHPDSPFVQSVMMARAQPERRLALRNARFSI